MFVANEVMNDQFITSYDIYPFHLKMHIQVERV